MCRPSAISDLSCVHMLRRLPVALALARARLATSNASQYVRASAYTIQTQAQAHNVRKAPAISGALVGSLPNGAIVKTLDIKRDFDTGNIWVNILFDGDNVWVLGKAGDASYLVPAPDATILPVVDETLDPITGDLKNEPSRLGTEHVIEKTPPNEKDLMRAYRDNKAAYKPNEVAELFLQVCKLKNITEEANMSIFRDDWLRELMDDLTKVADDVRSVLLYDIVDVLPVIHAADKTTGGVAVSGPSGDIMVAGLSSAFSLHGNPIQFLRSLRACLTAVVSSLVLDPSKSRHCDSKVGDIKSTCIIALTIIECH